MSGGVRCLPSKTFSLVVMPFLIKMSSHSVLSPDTSKVLPDMIGTAVTVVLVNNNVKVGRRKSE